LRSPPRDAADYGSEPPNHGQHFNPRRRPAPARNIVPSATYGDKRREVGMDGWGWEQLQPWQRLRVQFPVGPLFCVIHGPTAGRNWEPASARRQLGRTAVAAGVRRRFAPHH
jgi:hypothetical protein